MRTKELADIAGISVRTLHYYDTIGLLSPEIDRENGYRNYSDQDVSTLQQILFFRQLNFKLTQIKDILNSPKYHQTEALLEQKDIILKEQTRLNNILKLIDKTIQAERGEITMTNEEKFSGVDFSHNPYEQEAREKWGDEKVEQANQNLKKMGAKEAEREFDEIYTQLADLRHLDPESDAAQQEIGKWYDFLNKVGEYTPEMFKNLGEMYTADERFTKNIDKYGDGLAEFMKEAMTVYYEQHKK
ncbi:HTH-type transcriptional activator mta [Jeotgalicoccus aerolatus]|uniref:DNA-binding transcriptional MerR regulator n=1 Tax=Jeotgalicoccus aerolatus TaxID=709510 RepID=A0ABS4HP05_9STAP|nr:MerR family transcriptional regulator [Jeotgalicoccus aerolatus]MBP1952638.1 DNA-binding transcriptional MerR regulator [Jeotgalicoccus aerolatus]GGD92037.1 MerR family transcriptional regulator [Jeotgalicoccus aerolatus]CAD2074139.1 HTH-type transcriptional activator mta [Jeotgalicoccus aerolatus]HJG32383.1 MerR family transcriptional regulator [Jeotgalicoccus aerolatus]